MKYYEYAIGNVSNRKNIIPEDGLIGLINSARKTNSELYFSMFQYDEEILEHMKIKKTVHSYRGKYYIKEICFDIDKSVNSDIFTKNRAVEFIKDLIDDWKIPLPFIKIWFSGRGYHIITPNFFGFQSSESLPAEMKSTISEYFPEVDMSLYEGTRLFRVGWTVNKKTNLYKTQLSYEELVRLEPKDIFELASSGKVRKVEEDDCDCYGEEDIPKYPDKIRKEMVKRHVDNTVANESTRIITCVQSLYTKGSSNGSRHITILRMASAWRRAGLPKDAIVKVLQDWAHTLEPAEVKRLVEDVYIKGYVYGCNDSIMSKHCDPKCIYYQHKNYTHEVQDVTTMAKNYKNFLSLSHICNLQDVYGLNNSFPLVAQDFVVVWADTGMGKTAFIQNLCVEIPVPILYLTLEFSAELLFRRFIQIANNATKDYVNDVFSNEFNIETQKKLIKPIEHIRVLDTSPNIKEMSKLIGQFNPKIVVIDTVGDIVVSGKNGTNEKMEIIGEDIKKLAQGTNTCIIGIHHISKNSSLDEKGKSKALTLHSGKGSSAIEQKADKVIGIEQDITNPSGRIVKALKARDDEKFIKHFIFDANNTFRYIPM